MQSMILRRLVRLFLAAALLVAQHSALAHQIWHYAARPAQLAAQLQVADTQLPAEKINALCELHASFGAVLGALGSAAAPAACVAPDHAANAAATLLERSNAPLAPSSRDPPALL